jgi:hypothetical protein
MLFSSTNYLQVPSTRPQRQARQQTPLALSLGTSRRTISLRRTFNCQGRSGQGDGTHSTTRNVPRQVTLSALIQPIASHLYAKDLTPLRYLCYSAAQRRHAIGSVDHFKQELLAQMSRAATQGRIDILVNSGEPCRSIRMGDLQMSTCCDAMQEDIKAGDVLLVELTNGAGMTVRYLLPRAEFTFGIAVP